MQVMQQVGRTYPSVFMHKNGQKVTYLVLKYFQTQMSEVKHVGGPHPAWGPPWATGG